MEDIYFTKEGEGSDLLFLHGWGCDGNIFRPITRLVSDAFTCYSLDLWGFGKSPAPPAEGWNAEDYADRLYLFCVREGIERVSIAAHSFGGRVATVFAAKYPERVNKLLLCASAGLRRFSVGRTAKVAAYKIKKFLCRCGFISPYCVTGGSADYNACDDAMRNTFVKTVNENLARFARRIKAPTLLVWGDGDTETPMWMAKKLNAYIADSSLIVLKGSHFVFAENYAAFAGIVRAFFGG